MLRATPLLAILLLAGCPSSSVHLDLTAIGQQHAGTPTWEIDVATPNLPGALHLRQQSGTANLYATLTPAGQTELDAGLAAAEASWHDPYTATGVDTTYFGFYDEDEPGAHAVDAHVDTVPPELQRLWTFGQAVRDQMNAGTAGTYVGAATTTP